MPTLAQIEDASPTLSDAAQAHLASLIKKSARYQGDQGLYPNVATMIGNANGTVKAQQLNAALILIDALGEGTVGITGAGDGLDYSQTRDREDLIDYMIDTLYESQLAASSTQVGRIRGSGRLCSLCGCWPCAPFCQGW